MDRVRVPSRGIRMMIYDILMTNPASRNSDKILYYEIAKRLGKEKATLKEFVFGDSLPNYETVRRSRQLLQEAIPSLRGCEEVQAERGLLEEEFHTEMSV